MRRTLVPALVPALLAALVLAAAACAPRQTVPDPPPPPRVGPGFWPAPVELPDTAPEEKPAPKPRRRAAPAPPPAVPAVPDVGEMIVLGKKEHVYFDELKMQLPARVDTGAATSSLHADSVEVFERDGEDWVRFFVTDASTGRMAELKRPLARTVRIKRHGEEPQRRRVVELLVRIGSLECRTQFTLTDRDQFNFPVLIGRSFLHGRAVVDVTREFATSPLSESDE